MVQGVISMSLCFDIRVVQQIVGLPRRLLQGGLGWLLLVSVCEWLVIVATVANLTGRIWFGR